MRVRVLVVDDNRSNLDNATGIQRAVELGVDAIQTDNPAVVLEELTKLGLRGSVSK